MLSLGLALLLALPLIPSLIAYNKGRSGFWWYVYGLGLWPVAFFHALLATPNSAVVDARRVAMGQGRRCPDCAEVVQRAAIVCRHCGRELPVMASPAAPASTAASDGGQKGEGLTATQLAVVVVIGAVFATGLIGAWSARDKGQPAPVADVPVWATPAEHSTVLVGCARGLEAARKAAPWTRDLRMTDPASTWMISAAGPRSGACGAVTEDEDGAVAIEVLCSDASVADCTRVLWVRRGDRTWTAPRG